MPRGGPPPYLLPPPPFSSLTWCPSDFSPSLPSLPLCFTSIPLPDYLPSHRQWIGGLHVEEDVVTSCHPSYRHSPSHDAPWRLWWAIAAAMADDTMGRLIDGQKIVRLSGCWRHEPGKTLSPATPIHVHAYHVFADIP